ncbi:hypothetical protein [Cyanobium sp. N5-Cardenillas]|uniref:hypothetical protein n=1 Tax=Cyanobium sp. N5-Cardenillas TaxID=2823720 RepID=UPI0020CC8395|nr:hypothetical protein [Cyanobium sp. N5-Cardenillas]MCP9786242.1 hypothetical protein [Cyanobium sp. N5-Cardenillas]
MVRPFTLGALPLGRFRPSVHLYPPLLLLTCLVASTAAPAVGSLPNESLGALEELRELLTPGFGASPEYLVGSGGIGLANPVTGLVVPPFQYSVAPYEVSVDGFVVPSGVFLARSGIATGGSLFRLSSPLSFLWPGTASTPGARLTWQAGTLFDNVFNGATGGFVPFRIVSVGSSEQDASTSDALELAIAAEPAGENPGQRQVGDVFETAPLLPGTELPPGAPTDQLPGDLPDGPGEGPIAEGPDPASVPGPLPLAGVAVAFRFSRHVRQRLRQGR